MDDPESRFAALSSLPEPSHPSSSRLASGKKNGNNNNGTTSAAASVVSKKSIEEELASLCSEIDEMFQDTAGEFENFGGVVMAAGDENKGGNDNDQVDDEVGYLYDDRSLASDARGGADQQLPGGDAYSDQQQAGAAEEGIVEPLISAAVESALTAPTSSVAASDIENAQKQKEAQQEAAQTYTSFRDINPEDFRKPWEVTSRHASNVSALGNQQHFTAPSGGEENRSVASYKSIEDELASLTSEMEEVLSEGAAEDIAEDDGGSVAQNICSSVHNARSVDGNITVTSAAAGKGALPPFVDIAKPSDPDPVRPSSYPRPSRPVAQAQSSVSIATTTMASFLAGNGSKSSLAAASSGNDGVQFSEEDASGNGAQAQRAKRSFIPPWQRKRANGASNGADNNNVPPSQHAPPQSMYLQSRGTNKATAEQLSGPIGASMILDVEQAAKIDEEYRGRTRNGRHGIPAAAAKPAESYRRLIMQWILPLKVQLSRQAREGVNYIDGKVGCISRLTGCTRTRVVLILVMGIFFVAANLIGDVVSVMDKIGLRGSSGKSSAAQIDSNNNPPTNADAASEQQPPAQKGWLGGLSVPSLGENGGGWGTGWFGERSAGLPPPPNMILPDWAEMLSDFESPFRPPAKAGKQRALQVSIPLAGNPPAVKQQQFDIPFFWHIPRSGGATMLEIMGSCVGLVLTSSVGARGGHDADPTLQVIETPAGSYVNVDTDSQPGIKRAIDLKLVESGLADVISSHIPVSATKLFQFTLNYRGRMFVLLRDPVERVASQFYELQKFSQLHAGMTLEQYAKSENDKDFNYMTKTLVNKPGPTTASLTDEDLNIAKELLRRKTVIGLLSDKGDTLLRFERYFGWSYDTAEDKTCAEKVLHWEWKNKGNADGPIAKGSQVYKDLVARNAFDIELYAYAKRLFKEQGAVLKREKIGFN